MCALVFSSPLVAGCTTHVEAAPPGAAAHGITVNGQGKASGQPTIARANVGIEVAAPTAEQAVSESNARTAQVIAALKQLGIAAKDIRTANFSVHFEQPYQGIPQPYYVEPGATPAPPPAPPAATPPAAPAAPGVPTKPSAAPKQAGAAGKSNAPAAAAASPPQPKVAMPSGFYRATNTVEVTIRDLDKAGQVLGAAAGAGANQMFGIAFEIEDPAPLEAEARKKAMVDARTRAERLAELGGVKLGPPISISEAGGGMPVPGPMVMRAEVGQVPIERGELTVIANVQVVYAIAGAR